MNKHTVLKISSLIVSVGLLALMLTIASPARGSQPQAPAVWPGYWQMGPSLDTTILGCTAGNGLARFTGIYYETTGLVYFMGGRCETDTITVGRVFTFDPVLQVFAATSSVMTTPVSNYTIARINNDGRGHGVGFYIVGGRLQDGTQTTAVQVYYPDANLVDTIATDPFPPTIPYSPGAVVSVSEKLYAFGGFDGTNMYAETYVYDPAATAGSRWTDSGCDLPTGRSYIASAVVNTDIYAIGGSELPALTAITDTVVLDTANMAACWQDDAMADLPVANDNTQAVYVDEPILDGGIYMVGGEWAPPGPYRWVFAYDIATDTWDDTFPELVIPDPAIGRRNFALVYVPSTAVAGIGTGIPGIWAFGGYDGSGTNAMSETSEYYSYIYQPVVLIPDAPEVVGLPGDTVDDNFILQNNTENTDSFNLSVASDVTWDYTIPTSVGPVAGDGGEAPFPFSVDIPADALCLDTGVFTVTATSVLSPTLSGSQAISVRPACEIIGTVLDANTGDPLLNAYVYAWSDAEYYDGYADAAGQYVLFDVLPDTYYVGASAMHFQPAAEVEVIISGSSITQNIDMLGSVMGWTPTELTYAFATGSQDSGTLTIDNTGTGPLYYSISLLDAGEPVPPLDTMPVPGLPRLDPQIAADISANGSADFVVVLSGQANLSAAYAVQDWNARGEYVYQTLRAYADQNQASVRRFLTASNANYTPLYIINAVIVRGGHLDLVNSLAARSDVAQIVANREFTTETQSWVEQMLIAPTTLVPEAVGWNIALVNANDVWALGYNGAGMVVSEVDSGTQWNHPALLNHYRGWNGTVADHNFNWYDPLGDYPSIPGDGSGHGTHVMGTMVGDDAAHTNQIGMAPGAKWISCKAGIVGTNSLDGLALLECAQWLIAPTDLNGNNPNPALRPNVVNNSWGGGDEDYWYAGAVGAWRAAGIFPAFSGGNAGPNCSTMHSPGDYWNVFTSGATDNTDVIASFSSRGPTDFANLLKPSISAPGSNIRSSVPTNAYANYSGTSMASPHSAGAVALLWDAAPELLGQIDLTSWLLEQTALPLTTSEGCGGDSPTDVPNNTYGWGRLDILAAVNAAQAGGVTPDWITVDPVNGTVLPGETAVVTLNFDVPLAEGVYTATLWLVADDPYHPDVRLPIEVTAADVPPTAEFTSNSPVLLGLEALFTSTSTGSGPMTFLWEFGDSITSTLENPSHVYAATGVYTVTLTATNDFGTDAVTHSFTVNGLPPEGEYHSPAPIMLGDPVTFTVVISGTGPFEYLWDFGDGITSTLESPTHIYTSSGTFTVTVTVTSDWGTVILTDQFVVNAPEQGDYFIYLPLTRKIP